MSYNRSMSTGPLFRFVAALEAPAGGARRGHGRHRALRRGPCATVEGGLTRRGALHASGPDPGVPGGEPGSTAEVQESRPELRQPPLYKVVLVNDDYTPMEFVVEVLQTFFHLDRNKATQIMLYVHTRGKGVAGVFTYQIAETKVTQVNEYSRKNQHPLLCTMEEA